VATVFGVYSLGESIADYLSKTYPTALSTDHPCKFRSVSSVELNRDNEFANTTVSIYLYRLTVNEFLRNSPRTSGALDQGIPLSLDLHYLVTAWATNHLDEHLVLTWALRQLYKRQTLTPSELSPEGGWSPDEIVQLLPEEIPTADMMRIWDALEPKYRLSVSYVARAVRVDLDGDDLTPAGLPVVARRDQYTKR
jgi:hypothetical protein